MTHHTNTDKTAVVADDYYYKPMSECPIGQKVIMLGQGGVSAISQWNGKEAFWLGWAPLPKVRKEPRVPAGYTAEELDRDNPYNQWMEDQ